MTAISGVPSTTISQSESMGYLCHMVHKLGATAYLTNLADRVAFLESDKPTHDEISIRLTKIETILKKMGPDQNNH